MTWQYAIQGKPQSTYSEAICIINYRFLSLKNTQPSLTKERYQRMRVTLMDELRYVGCPSLDRITWANDG
jgi:hypothetical protein